MSFLSKVHKGKKHKPPRLFVYGTEGIGKSTFASQAPRPIFIQTEDGLDEIDCESLPFCERYEDVVAQLQDLATEEHEYETVAIDSLDWLERLVWDRLCRDYGVKGIEKVDGGYGKGYTHALDYWRELLGLLDTCRNRRSMVVVLIAHAKVERFEDPEAAAYDRYTPRLHKHAGGLIREWADAVLFATRKFRTQTEEGGFNKKRTVAHAIGKAGGDRVLRAVGGPSCIAKNRYGITEEIPLSWTAFMEALSARQAVQNNSDEGA